MTTTQRRAREKERRRRSILDAARVVFFEGGFQQATVDDVAARAEVSKGTVYLYFESKETILAFLLLEGLEELVAVLEEAYAPERDIAAGERLRRLAMGYLNFFQANPHYYRLIMAFDRGPARALRASSGPQLAWLSLGGSGPATGNRGGDLQQ
jgi:AcrR family transcriptional regulator